MNVIKTYFFILNWVHFRHNHRYAKQKEYVSWIRYSICREGVGAEAPCKSGGSEGIFAGDHGASAHPPSSRALGNSFSNENFI